MSMNHLVKVVYRRKDSLPLPDGRDYGQFEIEEDGRRPSLSEVLRAMQDQGNYIVGVSFTCEHPGSSCPCIEETR